MWRSFLLSSFSSLHYAWTPLLISQSCTVTGTSKFLLSPVTALPQLAFQLTMFNYQVSLDFSRLCSSNDSWDFCRVDVSMNVGVDFNGVCHSIVDNSDFFWAIGDDKAEITISSRWTSASSQSRVSEITVNGAGGRWRCGEHSACKVGHHLRPVHSRDRLSMELSRRRHSNHRFECEGLLMWWRRESREAAGNDLGWNNGFLDSWWVKTISCQTIKIGY